METTTGWKALAILSAAHREGLKKLERMEWAAEELRRGEVARAAAELRTLFAFFNGELRTHFAHEEESLFPVLSRSIGPMSPVEVMLEEHRSLWRAIDALELALGRLEHGEAGAADEVQRVARHIVWLLRSHIEKEDQMLFPMAERCLRQPEKQEVTSGIEARP